MKEYKVDMLAVFGPNTAQPGEVTGSEQIQAKSMKEAAKKCRDAFHSQLVEQGIPPEDVVFKVTDVTEL